MTSFIRRLAASVSRQVNNIKNFRRYNTTIPGESPKSINFEELYGIGIIGGGIIGAGCGLGAGLHDIYNKKYKTNIMDDVCEVSACTFAGTVGGIFCGCMSPIIVPILCLCVGVTPFVMTTRYAKLEKKS